MANKSIDDQIQNCIASFTEELGSLVKVAALEAVEAALGGGSAPAPSQRRGRAPARKASPGKRIRRSAAHLEQDKSAVASFVRSNPGQRLEEISKAMGVESKNLKRPVLLLLEEGALRKEGEKRGTRYYPAGRGASKAKAPARKKAARKTGKRKTKKAGAKRKATRR